MPKTRYSIDLARVICARIAGGESLARICRDPAMPGKSTVMDWLCTKPEFRELYVRARELQADTLFDEILAIADDEPEAGAGAGEPAQRSKLRVETRKWIVARLAPKKYGDKVAIAGGGDDDRPVLIQVVTGVPRAGDA